MSASKDPDTAAIAIGYWIVAISVLSGPAILAYETFCWLRDGRWPDLTLHALTDGQRKHADWKGIDQIIDWLWSQDISTLAFVVGMPFGILIWNILEAAEKPR